MLAHREQLLLFMSWFINDSPFSANFLSQPYSHVPWNLLQPFLYCQDSCPGGTCREVNLNRQKHKSRKQGCAMISLLDFALFDSLAVLCWMFFEWFCFISTYFHVPRSSTVGAAVLHFGPATRPCGHLALPGHFKANFLYALAISLSEAPLSTPSTLGKQPDLRSQNPKPPR